MQVRSTTLRHLKLNVDFDLDFDLVLDLDQVYDWIEAIAGVRDFPP